MSDSKWVMNRSGLLNFWYYDEEIFQFSDGKLLLRGTNGSGKSVTMQSFLPVLLDGKKSPDRLDPFGSKARRMEDYLLGEKEVVDRDERTGYLFIEYKKQDTDQFITAGIGMQAKRHKGIKSWYFLITDNRRIGDDFQLAHDHLGDRIPLSAKELENRIIPGGYVVHTQREYMELVNKYIFGFQSIEAYEDLIKLLIQLRSPKLSKDFKPTVIYEILESALPPLTDDELRHLSDTIENMDQARQQIEQLEREYESSQKLVKQYHAYNQYVLAERAVQWQTAQKRKKDADEDANSLSHKKHELDKEIDRLIKDKENYTQQRDIAKLEGERLREHEVWKLEKEKNEKKDVINTLNKDIEALEDKWKYKKKQYQDNRESRERAESNLYKHESKMKDILDELQEDKDVAAFTQHETNANDFERNQTGDFDFTVWNQEASQHEELLTHLKKLSDDYERLSVEHDRLQRESSEKKKKIDELRKNQDDLEQWFTEVKQQLEHDVFAWIKEHSQLTFNQDDIQLISRSLQGLYDDNHYDEVRGKLISTIHDYEAKIKTDIAVTSQKIADKNEEITKTEVDLHYWKTLKMPNPERANDTNVFREKLMEDGVVHIPFYAAVEFQDHVTEEQKERLESALKQIGLLDSLITEKPITPTHDWVIHSKPMLLRPTLADYLRPDIEENSVIPESLIDEVLRSVSLEQDGTGFHIDADGTFSIGCLVGHAPNDGPSKYIGRSSRKRFQQEKIREYTGHLEQLQLELKELKNELLQYQTELRDVNDWKTNIPNDKDLIDIYNQLESNAKTIELEQDSLNRLDQRWKEVLKQIQTLKTELHKHGSHLNLTLKAETVGQALKAIRNYRDHLHRLENIFKDYMYSRKNIQDLNVRIKEIEAEMDEIKGEQDVKEANLSRTKAEVVSIEEQLKLKGVDEVRRRIQEVQQSLREAEKKIEEIRNNLPQKKADYNTCESQLSEAITRSEFWSNMTSEWEEIVTTEISRGFIEVEVKEPSGIVKQLGGILEKYDRAKLNEQLTKVFLAEQQNLTEYRMFEFSEENDPPKWFNDDHGDYYEPFKNEWMSHRGRRLIQMEYLGQRVSPYFVASSLEKELEDQKGWLDDQDRKLYEDIIVNSVGVILRNRIQRAEKWVREMDKIMESRDNSSGLTFSIAWKPLTAESEQELDTKDLVKLLQRNSKFLSEEDLNKITKHFQSRIAKAKELIQLRNEGSTLHQVLKEVLDYRKWFTFVLSFKRVNESKRELTNTAFFKFSGGEKAMAMYIPLFTAAYSRYKEAGVMAPYIISLDEAFAGVDENNIRDMFEVVEQLGFNYIMNSQALWGDYDTISSLSICELVRLKNADFVTVIRYEWDGKERTLIINEEEPSELVTSE